jgi:methylase of polypeptide subunit release factors
VEKILLKKTELNKSQFFLSGNIELSEKNLEELKNIFKKVAFGYPIEYVLEKAEFY